jgi:hypothetical protein
MDIIINQPQLVNVVKLYLKKSFGNLTPKTNPKYPDSIFYVNSDNKIFMEYDEKKEYLWIDNDLIWSKLESLFYIDYDDIQLIMKDWLEEHYNLKKVTLHVAETLTHLLLGEHYKFNIV